MAIKTARVAVNDTEPTLLSAGRSTDFAPGRAIAVYNPGPAEVLLGGEDVGGADDLGFGLQSKQTFTADLRGNDLLYARMGTGTQQIHVMQVGI